jgi:hypothetical protein
VPITGRPCDPCALRAHAGPPGLFLRLLATLVAVGHLRQVSGGKTCPARRAATRARAVGSWMVRGCDVGIAAVDVGLGVGIRLGFTAVFRYVPNGDSLPPHDAF